MSTTVVTGRAPPTGAGTGTGSSAAGSGDSTVAESPEPGSSAAAAGDGDGSGDGSGAGGGASKSASSAAASPQWNSTLVTLHDAASTSHSWLSSIVLAAALPVAITVGVNETATSTVPAAFSAILCTAKSGNWMPVRNFSHAAKPAWPTYTA